MTKVGLAYAGPLPFATLRFCLGALCLIPVVIKVGAPLFPARHQWRPVLLLGLMLAINFGCTLTALRLRYLVF
jgi:drug/metabolite transporter (DMT)-like permease